MLELINYNEDELKSIAQYIYHIFKFKRVKEYLNGFTDTMYSDLSRENKLKIYNLLDKSISQNNLQYNNKNEIKDELNIICDIYHERITEQSFNSLLRTNIVSKDVILSELKAILKKSNGMRFDGKSLEVEAGPFEIYGVEFGNFRIKFDLHLFYSYNSEDFLSPKIKAVTPNYPKGNSVNPHPHVSSNQLCIGRGTFALKKSYEEGRIYDALEIIISILNTYGDEPFVSIENWNGVQCHICGDMFCADDEEICVKCESVVCENCSKTCCGDDIVCLSCNKSKFECKVCWNRVCSECLQICPICLFKSCQKHAGEIYHICPES